MSGDDASIESATPLASPREPTKPALADAATEPSSPDELPPSMIDAKINDRYVIASVLGRGGMGTVYLARDLSLDRPVALKLHRAGSGNARLHNEAVAMAKLAHPNVLTVFEVGTVDDRLYVAMEYVRGETLRGWCASTRRGWRDSVELLIEIGKGLSAAHAAGVVHRDLKPENVLVGEDGRPRVSDFGLAASVDRPEPTDTLMGTPAYMAPELIEGSAATAHSDQFAFCVLAWECLYGVRPFAGATLAAMALAAERGELQRPAKTDVPPRVRDAIERGLRLDPAERHRDMPALVTTLRDATMPRAPGRIAIAIGAACVSTVALGITLVSHGASERCAIDDDAFVGVWGGATTDRVRHAFAASGVPDSGAVFDRVKRALDDYRDAWLEMRHDACEATRLRGEQSESLLDLRIACLDRKRDELRALANGLGDADRAAVTGSVRAALGLSAIAECADTTALGAPVRPPLPQIRDAVEKERSQLAGVRALRLLGKIGPALDATKAIAARARPLGYRPLDAEVELALGDLQDRAGDSAAAAKQIEQAIVAAEAGNHRLVAAQAWSNLAWIVGTEDRQFDRADFDIAMAHAAIDALGGNPELSAQLVNYEALILETKHQLPQAKAKYLEALDARERMGQRDSWQMSLVLNDLGGVERKLGDYTAARAHHERALAIRKQLFGERHPYVFSSLNNLGNVAWSEGDFVEAEKRFVAAIAVGDAVFPANHPQKALALANLASAYDKQGKWDDSVRAYRRALEIYEAVRGPDHADVADTLHNLGNVYATIDRDAEAIEVYARALAILDKPDADEPALASLLYDFGDVLVRLHDARAEAFLQRAITLGEKAGKDTPELAFPLTALGELYASTGRRTDAGPLLARAMVLRSPTGTPPEERARTELALARFFWEVPELHGRAIELAGEARAHLEHAGPGDRKAQAQVDAWLRDHH